VKGHYWLLLMSKKIISAVDPD